MDRAPVRSGFPYRDAAPGMLISPRVGARSLPREKWEPVEPPRLAPRWPTYWERFRDEIGYDVWINPVTNERRYDDPYE